MDTKTQTALNNFLRLAQGVVDAHMTRCFPNLPREFLSLEPGRRYAKVVRTHSGMRSVYCFVDLTNGDILKAASWRGPAKHARGSIFAPDPTKGIGPYGADYLQ